MPPFPVRCQGLPTACSLHQNNPATSEANSFSTMTYFYLLAIVIIICYRLRRLLCYHFFWRIWAWMCDSVLALEDNPGLPMYESTATIRVRDYAVSTGASHRYYYMPHDCDPGDLEAERGRYNY